MLLMLIVGVSQTHGISFMLHQGPAVHYSGMSMIAHRALVGSRLIRRKGKYIYLDKTFDIKRALNIMHYT